MNEELKVIIKAEINDLKAKVNEAKKDIKGIEKDSSKTAKAVNTVFKKAGEGISKAFKTAAKGSVAVVSAIGGIAAAAVKGYANYEQLKGGVEKLFDTSSKTIMNYANDAYKVSGLTANQYMETVTGFSAGLIASMGGDTAAAAEVANMAINDMADNASVFGTSIGDIQNAYQGFAKQNYTMLDNLKLGYGGTREEMLRLLEDAEKISGIHYDISNLDDIYEAIHVIQGEMEITGNAANEASKTISGSINAAKSAWSNLITGLADDEANIPQLVSNVVETSSKVIQNIIPIVKEVLSHLPEAISEVSPQAGAAFQTIVDVGSGVFNTLKAIVVPVFDAIIAGLGFIEEHSVAFTILAGAVGVLVGAITLYNTVQAISNGIQAIKIGLNLAEETTLWGVAKAAMAALAPYILIVAAIGAVIAIIVVCIKHWDKIKETVSKVTESIKKKVAGMKDKVVERFQELKDKIETKVNMLKERMYEIWESIKENTVGKIVGMKDKAVEKFESMKESIKSKVESLKNSVADKFEAVKSKITSPIETAKAKIKSIIDTIKGYFHFTWSLPKLKMPHFTHSGKFSLNPPSVPKFHISWYKNGGVFDSPTLFNYGSGSIGGLGEAGAEAIVPLEKNTKWLDRIADRLGARNTPIVLEVDGKVFAQTSIDSINNLTKQTGKLNLRLV